MSGSESSESSKSSLHRLLSAEKELEGFLEERRAEADRIREEAREYARRRTAELEESVESQMEELRRRVERETARSLAEIRSRAERRIERYGDPSSEALAPLAEMVVGAVRRGADADEPGRR